MHLKCLRILSKSLKMLVLLSLIHLTSCTDDEENALITENEATIALALQAGDTIWNQPSIEYTLETTDFDPIIDVLVDGAYVNTYTNGDVITLNTKDYEDGQHEITLNVLDGDAAVNSASVEVHFLNTLAVFHFDDFLSDQSEGYVLIDYFGEPVTYEAIVNNQTVSVERPNDFEESHFNVSYIYTNNFSFFAVHSKKNVTYHEQNFNTETEEGVVYNFEVENLPTSYDFYYVSGPYGMGPGPSEQFGISLESAYTQHVTDLQKDFFLYIETENTDSYLYVEDLNLLGDNAVYDYANASTDMDSYNLDFSDSMSFLAVTMQGDANRELTVFSNNIFLPEFTTLDFSLPKLSNFDLYDSYYIKQQRHRSDDKFMTIIDRHNSFRVKEPVDLDYTFTNPGLGDMDITITGDFDTIDYTVKYLSDSNNQFRWNVSYGSYNEDFTFPSIPDELFGDFDAYMSNFSYEGTSMSVIKTDEEGTEYYLNDSE